MIDFLVFIVALALIIKSADLAMKYSSTVAKDLGISNHLVGFLIVAIISVLPETFISVMAAFQGEPALGLGTLFGSNVADLTLVFAVILFFANRDIKVRSKIVTSNLLYLGAIALPLLLGLDGAYSRFDGLLLVAVGVIFHLWMVKRDKRTYMRVGYTFSIRNFIFLLLSMVLLLIGSYLTVKHGIELAYQLNLSPIVIGLLGLSLGTTLPELFFSIKAVGRKQDELALGDILGTVITDAVIVVGIVALIAPFTFPMRIIYITGVFMLVAAMILLYFMKTERSLTRKEGVFLFAVYLLFVFTELNYAIF